jgi:NitT/TauT family transport system substrate-binding protein
VSHQALLLQMAVAKEWGFENYKKLDHLTVGLGQMDAVAAMSSPGHEVTTDFPTPPFLYIEREMPGVRTILTMKEILNGERGTIGTAVASSKFRAANPVIYKAMLEAIKEAMEIIAKDKERAVDGYIAATGDKKTARRLLMTAASDPDAEFTMTPRSMKAFAEFMFKVGRTKRNPDTWQEMFYDEVKNLPGT